MIRRLLIASEDLLGSSIAPQVLPHCTVTYVPRYINTCIERWGGVMGFGIKCWEDGWIDTSDTVKTSRAPVVLIKDWASMFSKIIFFWCQGAAMDTGQLTYFGKHSGLICVFFCRKRVCFRLTYSCSKILLKVTLDWRVFSLFQWNFRITLTGVFFVILFPWNDDFPEIYGHLCKLLDKWRLAHPWLSHKHHLKLGMWKTGAGKTVDNFK